MRSPMPHIGGKWTCLPHILPRLPQDSKKFVDVFGGGGSVILARKHANIEIYNDLDSNLYNFFNVVKFLSLSFLDRLEFLYQVSPQEFGQLKDFVAGKPFKQNYLQRESEVARKRLTGEQLTEILALLKRKFEFDDVNRAAAYFLTKKLSYASNGKSYQATTAFNLEGVSRDISRLSNRLKSIGLENRDYKKVHASHDHPDTLIYFDPPYYGTEKMYIEVFTMDDHYQLFEIIKNSKSRILLSYNDCEFIRDLYKDFYQYYFERPDSIALKHNKDKKFREILIANYDMEQVFKQSTQQISLFNYEGGFLNEIQ